MSDFFQKNAAAADGDVANASDIANEKPNRVDIRYDKKISTVTSAANVSNYKVKVWPTLSEDFVTGTNALGMNVEMVERKRAMMRLEKRRNEYLEEAFRGGFAVDGRLIVDSAPLAEVVLDVDHDFDRVADARDDAVLGVGDLDQEAVKRLVLTLERIKHGRGLGAVFDIRFNADRAVGRRQRVIGMHDGGRLAAEIPFLDDGVDQGKRLAMREQPGRREGEFRPQ